MKKFNSLTEAIHECSTIPTPDQEHDEPTEQALNELVRQEARLKGIPEENVEQLLSE